MLNRLPILIVEDEPYIALDLAFAIEDAGGRAIGPVSGVQEALTLLGTAEIAAAILDVNLPDGDISPVVERLAEMGCPVILQTGIGLPPALADRFSSLIVHIKPCRPERLIAELEELLGTSEAARAGPEQEQAGRPRIARQDAASSAWKKN